MRRNILIAIIIFACAAVGAGGFLWYRAATFPRPAQAENFAAEIQPLPNPDDIRGVYMTANTAQGKGVGAKTKRDRIMRLIDTTELNALVIDVKESGGAEITDGLKTFLASLADKPVWKIARVVTFADNSQAAAHPDWYLHNAGGGVWRDKNGTTWLDPASVGAQNYLIDFAKKVAELGFDEIQFDYIRYPSDGAIGTIVRSASKKTKRDSIKNVFKRFAEELHAYNGALRVSIDVFGYVTQRPEISIGQALDDAVPYLDYISPMVYPSHYYSGFSMNKDVARGLPGVSLNAKGANADPETVVGRSLMAAEDTIAAVSGTLRRAKIRPWLQDFSLGYPYRAPQVRGQIDVAAGAGASGYLLWNAGNNYTEGALGNE